MELKPVNLLGGFYQDDNLPWSAQDAVNWIPRPAEQAGTISSIKLVGAPGLSYRAEIDDAPIRIGGMRNVEGRLFVVAGTTLYEVSTDYVATVRGTIPGVGPVSMEHNQQEFGNELSVANGDSAYVWNTFTNTFTQVTDDAFTGSSQTTYLNRRLIHLDPFGRFLYPSDIDDALSYDALDRTDSEASPDKFVGQGINQFELVGLSQRTMEFYSDTGATEQPFRSKKIAIQTGCASRTSIVQLDNSLMWLGHDGVFYRLNGYAAVPISTGPINKAIQGLNWSQCFGFVWEDRHHKVAYWTFPDGQTWGYDAWTGLWHRRESFGLNRWRLNMAVNWNGKWIGGDFQRGRLYELDWDTYHEAGRPLVAMRTAPPIYNNGNDIVCPLLELAFDTGRGGSVGSLPPIALSGDLSDGVQTLSYSSGPLTVVNGAEPYQWSSSTLPAGLSINPDTGLVSGTPEAEGTFDVVIYVTDVHGRSASSPQSITISPMPYLVTFDNGNLRIRRNDVGYPIIQSIALTAANSIATSADGRYLAFGQSSGTAIRLFVMNASGGYVEKVSAFSNSPTAGTARDVAISSDAMWIAWPNSGTETWIYKKNPDDTYTRVQVLSTTSIRGALAFSPDTNYLVGCGNTPNLLVWQRSGDVFTQIHSSNPSDGEGLSWMSDSSAFAYARRLNSVQCYGVSGSTVSLLGQSIATLDGEGQCTWGRDNVHLYVRDNAGATQLQVFEWTGTQFNLLTAPTTQPAFSNHYLQCSVAGDIVVTFGTIALTYIYTIGSNGLLTFASSIASASVPPAMIKSITGQAPR